jgi:hypothetical protein
VSGESFHRGHESVFDELGCVTLGQMREQHVAGLAFDERGDGGLVVRSHDQVAFPMSGDSAILNFGGSFADHDHR